MAGVATAVLVWGVDRPALWLDESASVVATQRTWADLWVLLGGADAPLVPYYALLKATSSAAVLVAPGLAAVPEVLVRLPSVAAAVLAVWALTLWLARRCPPELAIATGALLLAIGAFSRYGQEARPYAVVLTAAVAATIVWSRLSHDRRRRWVACYAAAVVALVAAHLLAAGLVLAHLVAATVTARHEDRRAVLLRTAGGAAIGLLVIAPFAVMAAARGRGTRPRQPLSPTEVLVAVAAVLADNVVLVLLAGAGLAVVAAVTVYAARSAPASYRFLALLAAAWAVVPLIALIPVVLLRPNLLKVRYVLFVLPGWVLLGAVSLVMVMDLLRRTLARVVHSGDPDRSPWRQRLVTATGYGLGVLAVTGVTVSQLETMMAVRGAGGHGEDIRPALAAANRAEYASLPIVVAPPNNALEVAAYAAAAEARLLDLRVQRDQPSIWPKADRLRAGGPLSSDPRVVLLVRATTTGECRWSAKGPVEAAAYVNRCAPEAVSGGGYRVEWAEARGRRWTFAVLTRD